MTPLRIGGSALGAGFKLRPNEQALPHSESVYNVVLIKGSLCRFNASL